MRVRKQRFPQLWQRLRFESLEGRRLLSADLVGPSFSPVVDASDVQLLEQSTGTAQEYLVIDNSDVSWQGLDGTAWIIDASSSFHDASGASPGFSLIQSANAEADARISLLNGLSDVTVSTDLSAQTGGPRPTIDIGTNRVSGFEDSNFSQDHMFFFPSITGGGRFLLGVVDSGSLNGDQIDKGSGDDSITSGQRPLTGELTGGASSQKPLEPPTYVTNTASDPGLNLDSNSNTDRAATPTLDETDSGRGSGRVGLDPGRSGLGSSTITSTFAVAPNRGLAESTAIEPNSLTSAGSLIDISVNKLDQLDTTNANKQTRYAAERVAIQSKSATTEFTVDSPNTGPYSSAEFRVEPIMARHHRIDFQSSPNGTARWTQSTDQPISFASAIGSFHGADSYADVDFLVRSILPGSDSVQRQVGRLDDRLTTPTHEASGQTATTSNAEEVTISPYNESPSFWQNAVDVLMAGAAGAMIYSQRIDSGKESRYSLG